MTGDISAPFDDPPEDLGGVLAQAERAKIRAVLDMATYMSAELDALPPPEPLIGGILNVDSLAMIYGPSGGGKTFLAIDLAMHVATAPRWHGREVKQGPVIYVAAEGARGLGPRVAAWQANQGLPDLDKYSPVYWLTRPVNLFDSDWAAEFVAFCADRNPVLVILDTLARCSVGADENSSRDMGLIVEAADEIKRSTGACVALVHHSGKGPGAGARGSSALRAAVDTEIEVIGGDDRVTVKVTKQKDGPEASPIHLWRKPVADSCALVAVGEYQGIETDG